MKITHRAKITVGAVTLIAGLGALGAGGLALTGTGLTDTAPATQFIGGTVTQSVTGATLSGIDYTFSDSTNSAIHSVLLTFADAGADGVTPTIAFTGGTALADFACSAVAAVGHTSTCTATSTDQTGTTSVAITDA